MMFHALIQNLTRFSVLDFHGWIWVPIASVPDLCILLTFTIELNVNGPFWLPIAQKVKCVGTNIVVYSNRGIFTGQDKRL